MGQSSKLATPSITKFLLDIYIYIYNKTQSFDEAKCLISLINEACTWIIAHIVDPISYSNFFLSTNP